MKCDCELKGEGCCSKCYDGPVTEVSSYKFGTISEDGKIITLNGEYTLEQLREITDLMQLAKGYQAHVEMEKAAHAQDPIQS